MPSTGPNTKPCASNGERIQTDEQAHLLTQSQAPRMPAQHPVLCFPQILVAVAMMPTIIAVPKGAG